MVYFQKIQLIIKRLAFILLIAAVCLSVNVVATQLVNAVKEDTFEHTSHVVLNAYFVDHRV